MGNPIIVKLEGVGGIVLFSRAGDTVRIEFAKPLGPDFLEFYPSTRVQTTLAGLQKIMAILETGGPDLGKML